MNINNFTLNEARDLAVMLRDLTPRINKLELLKVLEEVETLLSDYLVDNIEDGGVFEDMPGIDQARTRVLELIEKLKKDMA